MKKLLSTEYSELYDTLLIIDTYIGETASHGTKMDIAIILCPYLKNLKKLVKNADNSKIIIDTIAHDYIGLQKNDEDFLPRLA